MQQFCETVYFVVEIVCESCVQQLRVASVDEFGKPWVVPHTVYPLLCLPIAIVCHELCLRTGLARVVVVCYVVVPERSPVEQRVGLVLIEIGTPEAVDVCRQLGTYIPVGKRHAVHPGPIPLVRVGIVPGVENGLEVGYIFLDILVLRGYNILIVRIYYAYGHRVGGRSEAVAIHKSVNLQQIPSADVGGVEQRQVLLYDIHPAFPDLHLVTNLVVAEIIAVEHKVHELGGGIELQRRELSHERCHGIAYETLVGSVGQQRPALGLGSVRAEKPLLVLELYAIWFLSESPCGIAPSPYLERVVSGNRVVLVDIVHGGIHVCLLACYGHVAESIYIYRRQIGLPDVCLRTGNKCREKE